MFLQPTWVIMRSPSLKARAPKTSTIFILSETLSGGKKKRVNRKIGNTKWGDKGPVWCPVAANLQRFQQRDALDEGLVHPPFLCVVFDNQSVKRGSILRERNVEIVTTLFHTQQSTVLDTHQGPQGTLLRRHDGRSSRRVVHER